MHLVFTYLMGKAHRCSPHQSKVLSHSPWESACQLDGH
uniref:Uncharacterized protein n=1 Tax=Anguilla anguilla TaxID=7936 RepID=A0A0E9S4P6_ANGAN